MWCKSQRSTASCTTYVKQLVGAAAGGHSAIAVNSKSANLTAGYHSIEVDYCNMYLSAELSLRWKGPNDTAYSVSAACKRMVMPCLAHWYQRQSHSCGVKVIVVYAWHGHDAEVNKCSSACVCQ